LGVDWVEVVVDIVLGVVGTEEGVEESWRRLIEGDSISTAGFLFLGVTGTGELCAMTESGSGLDSGGAMMWAALDTGVLAGLGMRGGGG
jgi:hypothetical protein